jgi:hypothetical protein
MERTQRASGSYYRLTMVGTKCWRSSAPRLGVVITDIFMSEADDATLESFAEDPEAVTQLAFG